MASAPADAQSCGYVFDELMMWHNPGPVQNIQGYIEPTRHWECVETKRRVHSLLAVSGMLDRLTHLKARQATEAELARVHDVAYIRRIKQLSDGAPPAAGQGDPTWWIAGTGCYVAGEGATFSPGGYEIACLAAGAALVALDAVMSGAVRSVYALTRPPGHHAERGEGRGFCVFNNIAVAAAAALAEHGCKRVAIVDFDVHHGNGTQHLFEADDRVLFISLHQDNNYPPKSGYAHERGTGPGEGFTINLPLPPGSATGAYKAAFERVVLPALHAYQPEVVFVSAGFDANYQDPLAAMALSSEDFRWMIAQLQAAANTLCGGRLVALHEGGYSDIYVPFCALALVEQLSGVRTPVHDPFLDEVHGWGYRDLQPHQEAVVAKGEEAMQLLSTKLAQQRA